ncbi:MAG: restriction endonuclease subunit S, partial [SAR324 cluster bacterium]|nr:restriction endonuclease subunit S [SAR324 cluster bacterium]
MMQFPRYESYKDSGVEWLGEIPSGWELKNLRTITNLVSKKNHPTLPVLSVYREYGVILKDSRDDNHNATSLDTSTYKMVEEGDLVVNKMKAWQGSMGISNYKGIVSPAYITCKVSCEAVYPKFLHYLLRSKPYIGVYNSLSYGVRVGQWDMHYEDFKKIPLPVPSKKQQKSIVKFLDQKTAEIDQAIEKKRRLIELLKEQKAILINRAVTKGLNPNVPMQDSDVEWIGEIPAHWTIKRAKY